MKTRPDALGTAENESWARKTWKRDPTPSVPPQTSPGPQNMKTGPDALGTADTSKYHKIPENSRKVQKTSELLCTNGIL
jgi:hypothetical protein